MKKLRLREVKGLEQVYTASLVAQTIKNLLAMQATQFSFLGWEEGHGNPLQYSCLENTMARGAWWAAVDGVTKS